MSIALQYVQREVSSLDWITILLVCCFVILTIVKQKYPYRFQEFIMLPLTDSYFLVQGKSNVVQHPFNMLLFVIQSIGFSLLVYSSFTVFFPEEVITNKYLFVQIITIYTLFACCKFCVEKIVGSTLSIDTLVNKYLYYKLTHRNLIGILALICSIFLFYVVNPSPTIFIVIAVIIVLLNCISLFYSYKTHSKLILGNFFYFILYLCALEFSPYIILYKVLI